MTQAKQADQGQRSILAFVVPAAPRQKQGEPAAQPSGAAQARADQQQRAGPSASLPSPPPPPPPPAADDSSRRPCSDACGTLPAPAAEADQLAAEPAQTAAPEQQQPQQQPQPSPQQEQPQPPPQPQQQDDDSGLGSRAAAGGLTEYELQRLERIRRNQEKMLSLGLGGPGIEPKKPAAPALPRRQPTKRPLAAPGAPPPAGVRRSARQRGPAAGGPPGGEADAPAAAPPPEEPEPEPEYDDSSVRRYVCEVLASGAGPDAGGGSSSSSPPAGVAISGFRRLPGCLADPALPRAYSVDWRPGLVVAGGKDGVVAVWGSRQLERGALASDASEPPLLSHKLHRGWVADVQLVGSCSSGAQGGGAGSACDGLLLLTAGNDGTACLWDLGRAAEAGRGGQAPQCLAQAADLHTGGIFSLHEVGGAVLTASKDGSVCVSRLGGGGGAAGLAPVQRFGELHQGVVKCARWRDGSGGVFGSCGNDRQLCVVDTRQPPSAGAGLTVADAHGTAINCLRWHPCCEHLLLSASHDPAILLHDLRAPGQPLHRFRGHGGGAGRIAAIYQPAFVAGGAALATGCERSTLLSLYCTKTGATISRGDVGVAVGATSCGAAAGSPLLCTAARAVYAFQPAWQSYSLAL